VDRVSIERMCAGKELCRHRKGPRGKVASNTGWSGKEIRIGRTQGSGRKIVRNDFRQVVRNDFRQVERLRGMKCFPGGETQFVGNTMTNRQPV